MTSRLPKLGECEAAGHSTLSLSLSLPITRGKTSFYWNKESNAVVVLPLLKENKRLRCAAFMSFFFKSREEKTKVCRRRRHSAAKLITPRRSLGPRRSRRLFISGPAARQHERRRYKDGVVCAICVSAACFSVFTQGSIPRLRGGGVVVRGSCCG